MDFFLLDYQPQTQTIPLKFLMMFISPTLVWLVELCVGPCTSGLWRGRSSSRYGLRKGRHGQLWDQVHVLSLLHT